MYVDTCEARVASRAVYGRVRGACVYLRLEAATAEVDHAFVACAASPGLRSQSGAHLVPIACREGVRAGDRLWPAVYSRARGTGCVG